ncbi:MAG: M28 family peptidase, partial [Sphingomonadaceae bacterium]
MYSSLDRLEAAMARHISVLASDDFGGRQPGTDGEAKTLRYLAREWQAAGLESGTNDPAHPWFEPVELLLSTPTGSDISFQKGRKRVAFDSSDDDPVIVFTSGRRSLVENAPLLLVGRHGIDLDRSELAGRVAIMLWDHPEEREQREALIEKGAAAVLAIVPEREELAELVAHRKHGQYLLKDEDSGTALDGYLSLETAKTLFGQDVIDQFIPDNNARPYPLKMTATMEATSKLADVQTHNLIARLPGKNPDAGAVLVVAHWDHFGHCGDSIDTSQICHGAVDNASGLAFVTELARILASGQRMDRDVYFRATTAEEWGLLGARAFAQEPALPLTDIVAAFNVDSIAVAPRGTSLSILGRGLTNLDHDIENVARKMGRHVNGAGPEVQYLRRQDVWALLQRDV